MKRLYSLLIFICLVLCIGIHDLQAQSLLAGWDNTSGTPFDAGWRVDAGISVTWGTLNGSGNRFRTNVGSPVNNGANPMMYVTMQDTKFGYPVTPTPRKIYQLSGKAWRRNGGTGSISFNFYFANDLSANNPASKTTLNVSGNNAVSTFNLRIASPDDFANGYFLWDAHLNSGSWADAGLWLLNMTELGNAFSVTFNSNGGNSIATQYFLEGDYYTVSKPANPVKNGYSFKGWYSDPELQNEFEFKTLVQQNTTIYAKWDNIKTELSDLIATATALLSGGTTTGQAYLNTQISNAQDVEENPSATLDEITAALNTLTAAIAVYKDASLSNLMVNGSSVAGFTSTNFAYFYNVAPNESIPVVSATVAAISVATVEITQASTLPACDSYC